MHRCVFFIIASLFLFSSLLCCTTEETTTTTNGVNLKDQLDDDVLDDDILDDDTTVDDDALDDDTSVADDDTGPDDDTSDDDTGDDDTTETTEVEIFDEEPVTKEEKTITANVDLPAGSWLRVVYHFYINAGSDQWDRLVVTSVDEGDVPVEIDRGITDWGFDLEYEREVTDFLPLLAGNQDISTYVSTYAEGVCWYVTSELVYHEANRTPPPDQIIPIIFRETMQVYPDQQIDTSSITKEIEFPAGMTGLTFSIFATGHSPTGSGSEEFGPLRTIRVFIDEDEVGHISPWRDDCHTTGSHGTTWPRSGWCPRDKVDEHLIAVANASNYTGTQEVTIAFDDVQRYWIVSMSAKVWE